MGGWENEKKKDRERERERAFAFALVVIIDFFFVAGESVVGGVMVMYCIKGRERDRGARAVWKEVESKKRVIKVLSLCGAMGG